MARGICGSRVVGRLLWLSRGRLYVRSDHRARRRDRKLRGWVGGESSLRVRRFFFSSIFLHIVKSFLGTKRFTIELSKKSINQRINDEYQLRSYINNTRKLEEGLGRH